MRKRVMRDRLLSYTFDGLKQPVLVVEQGEQFLVETKESSDGLIRSEADLPTPARLKPNSDFEPGKFNPLTGPIYVEGASRGDLLEVSIEEIVPTTAGLTFIQEGCGPLANSRKWPELGESYTRVIRHLPGPSGTLRDGTAIFSESITWPLEPFIGTIGTAPDFELHSSVVGQLPNAGNWDCRDIKEGSRLFLNCHHEGGLLYIGDVHASQGDSEWSGSAANEVQAEVALRCRVIKNKKIPYARIEKQDSIVQLFADKPLEEAVHRAVIALMEWMVDEYGMKPRDAYILLTIDPGFRINVYQMIRDPSFKYVAGAEYPKRHLKA